MRFYNGLLKLSWCGSSPRPVHARNSGNSACGMHAAPGKFLPGTASVRKVQSAKATVFPIIVFAAACCPSTSLAQSSLGILESKESSTSNTLDELNIFGSDDTDGTPVTGEVVTDEHTGSRSRIEQTRLEQPGSQLADLISSATGVQQRQSGGFGTYSSITVRAASAAQTAVYLDGILLNSGGENVIDLSTLEILNLSSVDVYKGSSPLQLGHASMGGAVNLNTRSAKAGPETRLRLGVGSFSQASILAATEGRSDKWNWTGSISRQQSDNDFEFVNNNSTSLNPFDDERQRRVNNQVQRSALLLKGGYQSSNTRQTDLLVQVAERKVGVPNARNSSNNRARYDTLKSQVQLSQVVDKWHGWNTRHSLYWHQADSVYDDSLSQVGLGAQYIDTDIRTLGTKAYWERFINLGTFGVSADLRNETLDLDDELNVDEHFTADRQLLVTTAHLAIFDKKDRWMLTPALRWQYSERRGTSTSTGVPATLPEQNESELGAQLGAAYSITPALTLSANAGHYFREPAFGELYGSVGLINGNPSLDPEKGINLDIGISYELDNLQLEATVFQSMRDELIITSYDARGIGRPSNTGEAEVTGLELEASWTPLPTLQVTANATFQNPRNRDPFKGYQDKLLPGEAKRTAFARIQYQPEFITYWYEWQSSAERFYDSTNLLPAKDTSLHSLGLDLKHQHWQFSARLQNLSDDTVEDFNGFPKPGRGVAMSITHTF